MPTLYVTEPGSRIEKDHHRLSVVSKDDEVLMAVPLASVSQVVLVGWTGATTPAMLALLDSGIGLTLISRSGRLRGRLTNPEQRNIFLRRKQYDFTAKPEQCLMVSRGIVTGKLANCRVLAMRMLRKLKALEAADCAGLAIQLQRLSEGWKKAQQAQTAGELLGLEGSGARAYFAILRRALSWQGDKPFERRNRRPPRDPVNALLSLGYSLLTDSLISALEIAGLDPYAGFYHAQAYGRPALALDLVEEFRPVVVDSLVLTLINKHMITEGDFEEGKEDGIYLSRKGLRIFFQQYSHRINTAIRHPFAGKPLSYQKCFELQARLLRKIIEGSGEPYQPLIVR